MADALPWFPCYPAKLLGAIAGMKPDQKLVYMIVLLRIYEVRGPCPDSIDALSIRVGLNKRRITDALHALHVAGKLVAVPGGILNPFAIKIMEKGDALHQERVAAGAKGGSTAAEKRKEKQTTTGSQAIPDAKHEDIELDLEIQKESKKDKDSAAKATERAPRQDAVKSDWPADYQQRFWSTYPRKTEKKAALAKLDAIRKSGTVPWPVLFAGVQRLAAKVKRAATEERYIKHPTTWLNRGCWDDQESPPTQPPQGPTTNGHAKVVIDHLTRQAEAQAEEDRRHAADARHLDYQPTLPALGGPRSSSHH